jgi:hypothetical protein
MKNFMTKSHQLARQLQADNNIKRYHTALSQAMKKLYNHIRTVKEIKLIPDSYKNIILNSNGRLSLEFFNELSEITLNKAIAKHLEKFAYKVVPYFGGTQLFFSNEIINALK